MNDDKLAEAMQSLNTVIDKARVHFYKPIQIAEILYHHRTQPGILDPLDKSTYRIVSRNWRDRITQRLVGRVSTSSARYQDNLFEDNAVPPEHLAILASENQAEAGRIEAYIYGKLREKWHDLIEAYNYIDNVTVHTFALDVFLDLFEYRAGLKRSVDKAYEIVVYALFTTLITALDAKVTIQLSNPDPDLLQDFRDFVGIVLGVSLEHPENSFRAAIYRAGITNAADRGLDMWTNYGPMIQVKHLRLDADLADDIAAEFPLSDVIIVCKTSEERLIRSVLNQVGLRIKGIITQRNLETWYASLLNKYADDYGEQLLTYLYDQFIQEFPQVNDIDNFMQERGYDV